MKNLDNNKLIIIFSPILVFFAWGALELWEDLGLVSLVLVIAFSYINCKSVKNLSIDKYLGITSLNYLLIFLYISFIEIWARHYALPPVGYEETFGYHRHTFWDSIFMHMH